MIQGFSVYRRNYGHWDVGSKEHGRLFRLRGGPGQWDRTIALPLDAETRDDLRSIRLVRGIPSIPQARHKGRHGDSAVGLCMLVAAVKSDYQPAAYTPVPGARSRMHGKSREEAEELEDIDGGGRFGTGGAW